jgi:hypothetical protein
MKIRMQTSFFLASYGFRGKVLVLVFEYSQKDPGSEKSHPGSGSRGVKNTESRIRIRTTGDGSSLLPYNFLTENQETLQKHNATATTTSLFGKQFS